MKFEPAVQLKDLASLTGSRIIGNEGDMVTGINEIHMVSGGDITFVDHPKYYEKALTSAATFVIINKEVTCPAGKSLLFSEDPFRDYVKIIQHFRPFKKADKAIAGTAEIGAGTIIQPNVFIGNEVKIGKNCVIHSGVSIYDHCILGDDVIIHSNTVIGSDAF